MSFVDDVGEGSNVAATPEEMDACLESLESAFQDLETTGTAADLVQLLEQIEFTRKAIASTFSALNDSLRPRFMVVFSDCERIARVRAVLDAIQHQHHQDDLLISDDRLARCLTACKFVESQLADLGLAISLEKAQLAAKVALRRRCNPQEDAMLMESTSSMMPGVPKPGDEAKARAYECEVFSNSEGENQGDREEPRKASLQIDDVPLLPQPPPPPPQPTDEESTEASTEIKFAAPIWMDGWMGLSGAMYNSEFKPRWLVMRQNKIGIYKDEGLYVCRGDVELTSSSQIQVPSTGLEERKHVFALWNVYYSSRGDPMDTFYFNAGNVETLHMWVAAMRHEIKSLQTGSDGFRDYPHEPTSAPMSLPQSSAACFTGWLGKRGPSIGYSWHPRWCVLEGSILSYHDDDRLKRKKGEIQLSRATRVVAFQSTADSIGDQPRHRDSKPFGFLIDSNPAAGPTRRIYYFNAGNDATLRAWLHALITASRNFAGDAPV